MNENAASGKTSGNLPENFRNHAFQNKFPSEYNNQLVPDPSQGRRETRGTRRRGTRRGPRRGTEEGRLGDAWETVGDSGGRRGTEGKPSGKLPETFRKMSGNLPENFRRLQAASPALSSLGGYKQFDLKVARIGGAKLQGEALAYIT